VRTSLDEMRRLSGPDLDASVPARWREHMQQAFVDVRPGERITGVYLPERGCRFYVNEPAVCRGLLRHLVRPAQPRPRLATQSAG